MPISRFAFGFGALLGIILVMLLLAGHAKKANDELVAKDNPIQSSNLSIDEK